MKCDKCGQEIVIYESCTINFYFTGRCEKVNSSLPSSRILRSEIVCPECFHKWDELIQYMRENEVKILD